jgi:serine/threonine protein kinase
MVSASKILSTLAPTLFLSIYPMAGLKRSFKTMFLHRDIKPANICLDTDFTAKLIDCGLAKFVEDGQVMQAGSIGRSLLKSSGASNAPLASLSLHSSAEPPVLAPSHPI